MKHGVHSWPSQSLVDVAEIASGVAKGRRLAGKTVEVPYIRVANVQAGRLDLSEIKEIEVLVDEVDKYRLQEGDILMTEGGDRDKLGRGTVWRGQIARCIHQNHVFRVRPAADRLSPEFLNYYMQTPAARGYFLRCAKQTTGIASINRTQLSRLPVPLPPLPEQRRIADILDAADSLRRKRAEAIRLANDLVPSLFYEMFGDPVSQPKGDWKPKSLCKLARPGTEVTYGIVQCGPHVSDGVPYVRTSDMTNDHLDVSQMGRTAPQIAARFTRSRVEAGELVISIRASVGTVHLVPPELEGANLTQGTARISPGEAVNNQWLLWALRSHGAQRWLDRQCKGTTFREITLGRLRELPLAAPPRKLQDEFATAAKAASDVLSMLKSSEGEINNLFHSLLQRAFRGEL